jgi:hypothetical protein
MSKFFGLINSDSLQERRFKAEYDQVRIKFISDHYSLINGRADDKIISDPEDTSKITPYFVLGKNILNLLNPENKSGKKLDTDSKFKLLNAARRAEILKYRNHECDTRIKQILIEATKLDVPWRKEAILQLLNKYKDIPTDDLSIEPVKTSLYEAAYIRDIHFDNIYYKSKLAKKTIGFLNGVLVALLSTFLIYSAFLEYGFEKPMPFLLGRFSDLWLVVLFGLLGAAFSTLLNLYKGNKLKNTVIKQIDAVNLTIARLVIGASAGLIVFIILNSDLIIIKGFNDTVNASPEIIGPRPLTLPMLSLIFVAGFTERLVLNFIEKLSTQQEKSDQQEKTPIEESLLNRENNNRKEKPNKKGHTISKRPTEVTPAGLG